LFEGLLLKPGIAVADFNGDGKADVLLSFFPWPNAMPADLLLSKGDGTFSSATGFATNPSWAGGQVTAGDFNRDGKPDFALAVGDEIEVRLGKGDGTFQIRNNDRKPRGGAARYWPGASISKPLRLQES